MREFKSVQEKLFWSSRRGEVEGVLEAIAEGANLNEKLQPGGLTPLEQAVARDERHCVVALLEGGAEARESGALMWSAIRGNEMCAWELLKAGADPNRRDPSSGFTPFGKSVSEGNERLARLMIKFGADCSMAFSLGPLDRKKAVSALALAGLTGGAEMVRVLLENGADPLARNCEGGQTALEAAMEHRITWGLDSRSEGLMILRAQTERAELEAHAKGAPGPARGSFGL